MFNYNKDYKKNFKLTAKIDGIEIPYIDLGWQLHSSTSKELKHCEDQGHQRREYDNSIYCNRGTNIIYICDKCLNFFHIDMSD